jgi:predicted DNA-binding transcriptional regulator AlpA
LLQTHNAQCIEDKNMNSPLPKLHRINDAAKALGVSRNTIYRFSNEGKLTRVQIGDNSSGITDESLRALMARGVIGAHPDGNRCNEDDGSSAVKQ